MRKIGLTTTIPIEVLLAKEVTPVDINNIFITDENYFKYIDIAEKDGFPKNACAWIKGIYGVCIDKGINEVIGVVEGDCSDTKALIEVLGLKGIKVYPFSFPHSHDLKDIELETRRFMDVFGVTLAAVEKKRMELAHVRELAKKIDELTYMQGTVSGFENHLYQVNMSDFEGDAASYTKRLERAISEISLRKGSKAKVRLGYIGVPPMTGDIYKFVEKFDAHIVYNEVQREFAFPRSSQALNIFEQYYDYTYPYDIEYRICEIKKQIKAREIDAIIHYTQAFCYRAIEDIVLRERLKLPMLNIEGDKQNCLDARTKLRLEAFLDMMIDVKDSKL